MAKLVWIPVLTGITMAVFAAIIPGWRLQKARIYEYSATDEMFVNPLMGYAPQADNEERYPESSLVYIDITWRELEPEEGVYDWEKIEEENNLNNWREMGKHAVLRFVCDIPGEESHMDIPGWLYESTGEDGVWYDISYGKGYAPNYNNSVFISRHADAIAALGDYFSRDGFVRYVELGSLGHWGEWHVKSGSGLPQMPYSDIRARYVEPYQTAFPTARLLLRRPFAESPEGGGVYNDMTGEPESTNEWLSWISDGGAYNQTGEEQGLKAMPEIWNTAPVGGEFTSSIGMDVMLISHLRETENLLKASHMTFIGPKIPPLDDNGEMVYEGKQLLRYLGYRYRVSKLKIFQGWKNTQLSLTWVNDGSAPIYWPWTPCLYLERSDGGFERIELDIDLTKLTSGKEMVAELSVPTQAFEKNYKQILVGIENPDSGMPAVYLPMSAKRYGTCSVLWSGNPI